MSQRIEKLQANLYRERFPLCIEKARLITESYKATEGEPAVIRRAKAQANILDNITIFIEDGELLVGNTASKPMGGELDFFYGTTTQEQLEELKSDVGWDISDEEIPEFCRKAENEFVGVECGIMDQFASMFARKDHALFLDCRNLEYKQIPFNSGDVSLLVIDTKVKRKLASSEYNTRRSQCTEAVGILKESGLEIESLRDLSPELLEGSRRILPPVVALLLWSFLVVYPDKVLKGGFWRLPDRYGDLAMYQKFEPTGLGCRLERLRRTGPVQRPSLHHGGLHSRSRQPVHWRTRRHHVSR